ncbi:MAG TPA: hypothetical protein VFO83_07225 [Aggregicoccus sp.]|nr:hypothetical protein [Aggregicoccus sp.]
MERRHWVGLGGGLVALAGAYGRWLRPWFHRWGASDDEVARAFPGDSLIPAPTYQTTLAVTVEAAPRDLWPWLVQLGNGRGGLYSYDALDRLFGVLDANSSDRILPEFQHLATEDTIPVGHDPRLYFPVAAVLPEKALVLAGELPPDGAWSWTLALAPIDAEHTRLVSRNRARVRPTLSRRLLMLWLEPAAFVMTRKMLLGIKERAERRRLRAVPRASTPGPQPSAPTPQQRT